MKSKIDYFMERDTRLVFSNLTKTIIDKDELIIDYTIQRKDYKDENFMAIHYIKDRNRLVIYDKLKKCNPKIYKAFIDWANDKKIEWFILDKKERRKWKKMENNYLSKI